MTSNLVFSDYSVFNDYGLKPLYIFRMTNDKRGESKNVRRNISGSDVSSR